MVMSQTLRGASVSVVCGTAWHAEEIADDVSAVTLTACRLPASM